MSMIKQTILSDGYPICMGSSEGGMVSCFKHPHGWVIKSYSRYFDDQQLIIEETDNDIKMNRIYYQRIEEIRELIVANDYSVSDIEHVFTEKGEMFRSGDRFPDFDTFREDRFKLEMAYKRGGVDEYLEVKKELLELRTKEDVNNYIWLDGLPYKNEEVL